MARSVEAEKGIDVARLRKWVDDAADVTLQARTESENARDYYLGIQWTETELAELKKRKQPAIFVNQVRRKIDYLRGAEQQSRTDPRAYPRTPDDEDAAQAATDALRYVEERERLDEIFSDVWEDMMVEGYGGLEIIVEEGRKGNEIAVKKWPWDRLFYDPHSSQPDFSDARYLGGFMWRESEDVEAEYPQFDISTITHNDQGEHTTYEDKPDHLHWHSVGGNRNRVKVCQMYYLEGNTWKWCVFTAGQKLDGGEVPFVDEDGMSFCPLFLQSAYIDRENNRHGIVRDMIPIQDEINKRRSKALHLMVSRQTMGEKGAVSSVTAAKRELAKPDGHVEINPGFKFEVLDNSSDIAAHATFLADAKADMSLMGPNAAMQGKDPRDQSGRAILAQQQGGMTELTPLLNRLRSLKIRTYRAVWNLIRQYWTEERWIRVTDDERNLRFVGLNRQVTMGEKAWEEAQKQGLEPYALEQVRLQIANDPQSQEVMTENVPADMDMDIIIDETPDSATLHAETFAGLVDMARSGVQIPPQVMIEASQLPNKSRLLELLEQNAQQPDPMQKMMGEITVQKEAANVDKTRMETARIAAEADKLQREAAGFETGD